VIKHFKKQYTECTKRATDDNNDDDETEKKTTYGDVLVTP